MKNITLNIIGQRILAEILEENKASIKMNIIVFEEINDYFKKEKIPNSNNIIVTSFSNFKLVEQLETNFSNPIFYIDTEKREKNIKTKFQRYELIYCPFSLKNFVEKINLIYLKSQFADNSKIIFLKYTLNLNSKEIFDDQNKLKLTEREKDFLLFLKNSGQPKTIKEILKFVWGYSKEIETHTVETHVHRLRKKFFNSFNDSNFIKNNKKGYYI